MINPISHTTQEGGTFLPFTWFFVINSFRKKIFILNQLDFSQNSSHITLENLEVAEATINFPNFEVFQSHFPKSEHFLATTELK